MKTRKRNRFGFANDISPKDIDGFKDQTIRPDDGDTSGNFHWFFGLNPDKRDISRKKFQTLANLGLLPDNNILSNKLINIFGKRLFDLIHDKSRTVEENKSLRKKIGLALGVSHEEISDNKRIDMHLCWMAVQKIRAIQELETLLNTSMTDFDDNVERVINNALKQINELLKLIPKETDETEDYIKKIYSAEREEIEALKNHLTSLNLKSTHLANLDQYHRNKVIQSWQDAAFRQVNNDFRKHEGRVGLYGLSVPLPKENASNSNTYNDAAYAVQEHVYQEWQPVTKSQCWMLDESDNSEVLSSQMYCKNARERKELLLGASICEQLDSFDHIDQISTENLVKARKHYQDRKAAMHTATLAEKKKTNFSPLKAIKKYVMPEQIDEETGLKLTSREFARYKRAVQIQLGGRARLDKQLADALQNLEINLRAITDEPVLKPSVEATMASRKDESELKSSAKATTAASDSTVNFQYAPIPHPVAPTKEDDVLNAALDFAHTFFLFFDKDMMAKRPYLAMSLFSVPFIQFGLPALAGSSAVFAKLMASIFTIEANIAKYTGLNALLQATIHQQLTAATIKQATEALCQGVEWMTCAEGTFEKVLVGFIVAKMCYNVGDLAINNPLLNPDAALVSEYLTTLFPEASGSLEGKTAAEQVMNVGVGVGKISLQMGLAALIIGGMEHFIPGVDAILGELASVPWDAIAHPHFTDIRILQLFGVSQAAAIIIFKTFGVIEKVESANLIDIDGYKLRDDSNSFKVLKFFRKLTISSKESRIRILNEMDEKEYAILREHFQELLSHNPSLWAIYQNKDGSYQSLSELGVEKIVPKRRHKYPMAFLKTIPAVIKMGLGIVPGILITIPVMIASEILNKAPHDLVKPDLLPLYRYGLESLHQWTKLIKIGMTWIKSTVHSFVAVAARTPEIVVGAIAFPFFIAANLFRPLGWVVQKIGGFDDNFFTTLSKNIIKAHAYVSYAVRSKIRYSLEKGFEYLLRQCRNVFIRKVEREIQVLSSSEVGKTEEVVTSKSASEVGKTEEAAKRKGSLGSTFNTTRKLIETKTDLIKQQQKTIPSSPRSVTPKATPVPERVLSTVSYNLSQSKNTLLTTSKSTVPSISRSASCPNFTS